MSKIRYGVSNRIRKKTIYEWDMETVFDDEDQDIEDHDHRSRLSEFGDNPFEPWLKGCFSRLCLVRDTWNDDTGDLINRTHAYLKDGELPDKFEDGHKVPEKYKKEYNGWRKKHVNTG